MKTLFLFMFFLVGIIGFSQDNLDSLMGIWQDNSKADTTRLQAMNEFLHGGANKEFSGNKLFGENPDSVLVLINIMQDFATAKGHPKYELFAVWFLGAYYQTLKDFPEAIKYFEKALAMANEMEDGRLIIYSLITLGNGQNAFLKYSEAEKYFQEALNLIEVRSINLDETPRIIDLQILRFGAMATNGLGILNHNQLNYTKAHGYYEKAIVLASEAKDENVLEDAMGRLGMVLTAQRNYPAAIKYYTKSLQLAEQKGDKHWIAHNLKGLGDLYTTVGEISTAEDYLTRALISMQGAGANHRSEQIGILVGLHNCFGSQEKFAKAIENDSIMLTLAEELFPPYIPYAMLCLASDYYELGDFTRTLEYSFKGFNWLKDFEEDGMQSYKMLLRNAFSVYIGKSYNAQGLFTKAIFWCEKAIQEQDLEIQKGSCECLYESHKALKNGNLALAFHEKYLILSDSLNNNELGEDLQKMEFAKQMMTDSIAQIEKDRLVQEAHQKDELASEKQRNILMGSGVAVLLFAVGLYSRLRYIRKSKAVLQVEKDRSENLLLNILPAEVAEELKQNGEAKARDYEMVSIIFTDFHGFTEMSSKMKADQLVSELNHCFKGFDAIMEKYSIEKIKTIGDAYMAAGGLPVPDKDSVKNTVLAALEMQKFISNRKVEMDTLHKHAFQMRAGIHTGAVVAGIVGVKKFQYDIWGDTVNTASRMETNSVIGKVNISEKTYELVKDDKEFIFEKRGKITVKGKGALEMYYVAMAS